MLISVLNVGVGAFVVKNVFEDFLVFATQDSLRHYYANVDLCGRQCADLIYSKLVLFPGREYLQLPPNILQISNSRNHTLPVAACKIPISTVVEVPRALAPP